MVKRTNPVNWPIWLVCSRLYGRDAAEARKEYDQMGTLREHMSDIDPLGGVPERERRWNRLVRNVAWLVAPLFAVTGLLVVLQRLSPWAKYSLVILGTIPLTIVVALGIELMAAWCYWLVGGRRRSA